jgi:uncharacterized protein YprB with RNaseH-like and TPR domain
LIWTQEDDNRLSGVHAKLAQENSGATPTFTQVASELTRLSGVVYTADQVRNRLRRIDENSTAVENARVYSVDEIEFEDVPTPIEDFVGFRIGFFDIETTNLGAIMGRMLVWSIADSWGNITTARITDFPQDSVIHDEAIAVALRDELERYDIICGWNSKLFDVSFLNARLLRWGQRPLRQDLMHSDPMYKARQGGYSARIGSSKLDNVAKFFRTPDQKTPLEWDTWNLAAAGSQEAMDKIVEHCEADVLVLRAVFGHLKPLIRSIHR